MHWYVQNEWWWGAVTDGPYIQRLNPTTSQTPGMRNAATTRTSECHLMVSRCFLNKPCLTIDDLGPLHRFFEAENAGKP